MWGTTYQLVQDFSHQQYERVQKKHKNRWTTRLRFFVPSNPRSNFPRKVPHSRQSPKPLYEKESPLYPGWVKGFRGVFQKVCWKNLRIFWSFVCFAFFCSNLGMAWMKKGGLGPRPDWECCETEMLVVMLHHEDRPFAPLTRGISGFKHASCLVSSRECRLRAWKRWWKKSKSCSAWDSSFFLLTTGRTPATSDTVNGKGLFFEDAKGKVHK